MPNDIGHFYGLNLISYAFVHASWRHLLVNVYLIFVFGSIIERHYGRMIFLFLFFLGALLGGIAHCLGMAIPIENFYFHFVKTESYLSGASGAVFALIVFDIFKKPLSTVYFIFYFFYLRIPIVFLSLTICFNTLIGLVEELQGNSTIGHFCHLGGIAAALLVIFWTRSKGRMPIRGGVTPGQ